MGRGMQVVFTRIAKPKDSILLRELDEVIAERPDLQPVPDRKMVNPFTKEPVIALGMGKALYLEQGKPVGNLSLEDGEVLTTGIPRVVCEELAALLAATVHDAGFS